MTNYERLKAMSLEEMARELMGVNGGGDILADLVCFNECEINGDKYDCPHQSASSENLPCHKRMARWLAQEAQEDTQRGENGFGSSGR